VLGSVAFAIKTIVNYLMTTNVFPNSSEAMAAILSLHFPTGKIIDVNYGHGVFYKLVDREITGVDIRPPAKIICDNRKLPFADNEYDVAVCDPPYKRGNGNEAYQARYGKAPCTEARVTKSYIEAIPEMLRVAKNGIIIKCQDASDGHTFLARHIVLSNWLHKPNSVTKGRTRRFFQQTLSYFLVYKWESKWRPLRF
jgi:hypothetical protein